MKKTDEAFTQQTAKQEELTTCGLCDRGMRDIETPKGWRVYRCDCFIGQQLGERSETWAKVKMLDKDSQPMPPSTNMYWEKKGLEYLRKHAPGAYNSIPQSVKDKINKPIPF